MTHRNPTHKPMDRSRPFRIQSRLRSTLAVTALLLIAAAVAFATPTVAPMGADGGNGRERAPLHPMLRVLLDIDRIPADAEAVFLGWEQSLPPWGWVLAILAAIGFAVWSYRGLVGFRRGRMALAGVRGLLLILLVVLLAGPTIVAPRDLVERDWVLVLVDRSQSLLINDEPRQRVNMLQAAAREPGGSDRTSTDDTPTDAGTAPSPTVEDANGYTARDAALIAALDAARPAFARLEQDHQVEWLGFHDGVFGLRAAPTTSAAPADPAAPTPPGPSGPPDDTGNSALSSLDLGDPVGQRTLLNESLDQALRRVAARPVSAIVLLSDGQSADRLSPAVRRRLEADRIPVFAFALGSPDATGDLGIRRVEAPRRAFVHDRVPIDIDLDILGRLTAERVQGGSPDGSGAGAPTPVVVTVIDRGSGEELARETWKVGPSGEVLGPADAAGGGRNASGAAGGLDPAQRRLTVNVMPNRALTGDREWAVQVQTPGRRDLVDINNTQIIPLELIDRPLRVLYLDGYPRWEFRYLKNTLVRETTVDASSILFSADRDFAQEGNTPISRMPRTAEEFEPFDVIIIGDVAPGLVSDAQWELIRRQVADRGAGILFLAGGRDNPRSYGLPALAALLPFQRGLTLPAFAQPVTMAPSPLAQALGVLRLDYYGRNAWSILTDPQYGWNRLQWALRIENADLKPAAEPLAVARPVGASTGLAEAGDRPLVIRMRYGAGQSLFVATDEIWRWRYGEGELLPEQFWIQLIRMLGRERLDTGGDDAAALAVRPRRADVGQPVVVDLRLLDAALLESLAFPDGIAVELVRLAGPAAVEVDARPDNAGDRGEGRDPNGDEEDAPVAERIALTLQPDQTAVLTGNARGGVAPDRFSTTFLTDQPGSYVVRVTEPALSSRGLMETFEVMEPDLELRRPDPDHALLADLAASTGGAFHLIEDLPKIDELPLPNRSIETPLDIEEPIWDTPLALMLLLLLLTLEWVGRKLLRLV